MSNTQETNNNLDADRYDERHRFWTEQAINQFGTTTNFFFIVSSAFLAFLVDQEHVTGAFRFNQGVPMSFSRLSLIFSFILIAISVFASGITVLSRLHDLRLTRHTIWIRKKTFEALKEKLPDDYIDLSEYSLCYQFKTFLGTVFSKEYFIKEPEISHHPYFKRKFWRLRLRNLILGQFSWWWMRVQMLALFLSFVWYITFKWFS
jgi:hypothetical protein